MPDMTEEERQAEFRRRRDAQQAAYDEQVAANAPNVGEPAPTEWSGLGSDYSQGAGQGTGEGAGGYKDFASSQAPNDAQPYRGQAFPGVPIIQEGGRFYAGGNNGYGGQGGNEFNTEAEAMAARARNAATDTQGQQLFQQQNEAAAAAGPATEPTSIQLMAEMSQRQLSPAQRLEMTQMQNGIARLQRDAREGRVPALQAAQLEAQLQARLRPRMVSQQELQGMSQALHYTQLREQTTHLAINNQRARAYDAAHGLEAQSIVRDSSGRELGAMVRNPDGSSHFVQAREDPAVARAARTEATNAASTERADAARLHHISQSVMNIRNEVQHELTQWRDPLNAPNAPEWTKTPEGIARERQSRIDEVHAEANRVFNAANGGSAPTQTAGQGGGAVRAGANAVAGAATGATPPATNAATPAEWKPLNDRPAVTRPDLETRDQPSDVSDARVHLLHQRMQDLLPASDREQWNNFRVNVHNPVPSNTNDLRGQIYSVLHRASDEGRALTNDERYWYINAQRALESRNPVEGQILDVQGSPIQRSYDAPADFVAKLSTEANTLHDSFSRWNPLTTNARATVNTMRGILGTAASDNRALTPAETTRYLRYLGDLRRIDPTMADNLRLNQFRARTP